MTFVGNSRDEVMTIRIANTPESWGIHDSDDSAPLFTPVQVMDQIAAGYDGLELGRWGFLPTDPAQLSAELDKRGLRLVAGGVICDFLDPQAVEQAVDTVQRMGGLVAALEGVCIVLTDMMGRVPELVRNAGRRTGSSLNNEQWERFAAGVSRVAAALHTLTGLPAAFRPFSATHVETADEVRRLLARTEAELVGLCLDTGHYYYGGGDPLEAVREFGARLRLLHLRDCDAGIREIAHKEKMDFHAAAAVGVFCAVGEGAVDFGALLNAADPLPHVTWGVVKGSAGLIDDLDAPRAEAGRTRDYLRKLGY
jgi:inosose dehydratase